jgi:hypothetical protein
VLRRIFERKRKELTGGCIKVHNDEPHNSYSPNSFFDDQIREDEMGIAYRKKRIN